MKKQVLVVGAGASGLMAAISAARRGAAVTILERNKQPGKKLLVTGNGRCNLTNLDPQLPDRYHGEDPDFPKKILRSFPAGEVRAFFHSLGMLTTEKQGYVYPYSGQSQTVLETLLLECQRLGVKLKLNETVVRIIKQREGWMLATSSWQYHADSVILCCGSAASASAEDNDHRLSIVNSLDLRMVPLRSALTGLNLLGDYFSKIAGVRCHGRVSLLADGEQMASEIGELQWTRYGISGIAVFQLAYLVSLLLREKRNLTLRIDLFPDFSEKELRAVLVNRHLLCLDQKGSALLCGLLPEKLANLWTKRFSVNSIDELCWMCKNWDIPIKGTREFTECQVLAGGISTREVSDESLEVHKHKGLFITGEILDVDGPCGGYNLQWAWSSGYTAGIYAAAVEQGNDYVE